jgi:hypothetical protein
VNTTRYRLLFALLGLAFAGVVAATVLLLPSGQEEPLPPVVERLSPGPGATVLRQVDLEIDVRAEYELEIFVDGFRLPMSEIDFTEPVGSYVWRPGPGKAYEEWTPGDHAVLIRWDTRSGLPDRGEFRWTFRVQ